jgi:hypothetical protein
VSVDPQHAPGSGRRPLHPWLRPLHRRLAITTALLVWLAFETWYEPLSLWFFMVAAITIYALWDFFLSGRSPGADRDDRPHS